MLSNAANHTSGMKGEMMNSVAVHISKLDKTIQLGRLALLCSVAAVIPHTMQAQLAVTEVCTVVSAACVAPGSKPAMRRGITETIKVKGPFVEHTALSGASTGASTVHVTGVSSCGSACLNMTVKVDASHNIGMRLVPIFLKNIFGATAFNAFIVRKGEITAMAQAPDPGTWGEPVAITITGNDIGDTRAAVSQSDVTNHVEAPGSGTGTTTFTVRATGAQTTTATGITLGDDAVTGITGNYRFAIPRRTVNYRPLTATACVSTQGITAPSLTSPANGQVFTFTTNPVQASITLRWASSFQGAFKPSEQFIVEIGPVGGNLTSTTLGQGVMSRNVLLNRNTTFQWRVRAFNCGLGAPFSPFSQFTVR
jgi:hypothetical protein